jgi:hypothetical protein
MMCRGEFPLLADCYLRVTGARLTSTKLADTVRSGRSLEYLDKV